MSGWLPTAPCTPEDCVAPAGPPVGAALRGLRCAGCALLLVAGVVLAPLVRCCTVGPRGREVRLRAVRGWARVMLRSFGVRLAVAGGPADGPSTAPAGAAGGPGPLLVSNHVSWLDILLLLAVRPGLMLAKTEVRGWPLVGPLAAWGGTVFLDRDRLRSLPGTVEEVAAALRRGERVSAFPEGSTWCGRGGGRFRPALFEAAVRVGAAVEPVAIRYTAADGGPATAAAFVGDDALLPSIGRVVASRGLVAEVVLLPAIPAGRHPGRRELALAAQRAVRSTLATQAPVPEPVRTAAAVPVQARRRVRLPARSA
ncbi:lysophospholipid acyltransferase family protein [Kitasatospora sp. NPDC059571]|uniref:lysophospholipid acyltransferase family protein n=1 Tax=Kitasatospora sp. NPDC059571 TaxID=3346871 RepID=UPI00369FC80A